MANEIGFKQLFDKEDFDSNLTALKVKIAEVSQAISQTATAADTLNQVLGGELKTKIQALTSSHSALDSELRKVRADFEAFKQTVASTKTTVDQYKTANDKLKEKVKEVETESKKLNATQKESGKVAKQATINYGQLSQSLIGVASGAALLYKGISMLKEQFVAALKSTIEFESAMKEVQAISRASGTAFQLLLNDANRLGATTEKTALQIAGLQKELAKLGFNTTEILAASDAIVDLSTATGEDLAGSARVAASTLRAFGLDATETTRVVDVMTGSFVRSGLDLEKFRESIKLVAPIAKATNVELEVVTASLSKLADAGLSGSLAGTALRNLLSNMADPTSRLSKRLGFTVQSSEDLIVAFKKLKEEGVGLSEAVKLVDVRARPAFFTLLNQIDAVEGLTLEYKSLNGESAVLADMMRDTLSNDIKIAESAFDAMRRNLAEQFIPEMRQVVQATTSLSEGMRFIIKDLFDAKSAFDALNPSLAISYGLLQPLVDIFSSVTKGFGDWLKIKQFDEASQNTRETLVGVNLELEGLNSKMQQYSNIQAKLKSKDFTGLGEVVNKLGEEYKDILDSVNEKRLTEAEGLKQVYARLQSNLVSQKGMLDQQDFSLKQVRQQIKLKEKVLEQINSEYNANIVGSEAEIKNRGKVEKIGHELNILYNKEKQLKEFNLLNAGKSLAIANLLKEAELKVTAAVEEQFKYRMELNRAVLLNLKNIEQSFNVEEKNFKALSINQREFIDLHDDLARRRLEVSKEITDTEIKQAELVYKEQLRTIERSSKDVVEANDEKQAAYQKYINKIQELRDKDLINLRTTIQSRLQAEVEYLDNAYDLNVKNIEEITVEVNNKTLSGLKLNEANLDLHLSRTRAMEVKEKLTTLSELTDIKKKALRQEYSIELLALYDKQIAEEKNAEEIGANVELIQEKYRRRREILQLEHDAKMAGIQTDSEEASIKIVKEGAKERKLLIMAGLQSIGTISNELTELSSLRRDKELDEINRWEAERIRLAGDNAEAIAAIEAEAEERRKEIKRKQAVSDKKQAIFNILLNTAQGIMAALAMVPPNIPLSIIVGATGAAQAAIVAARPLPEFYKGTDNAPEGHAWVGERGRELVKDGKTGKVSVTPDKPTIAYLTKGSVVIPHEKTERILASHNPDYNGIVLNKSVERVQSNQPSIDYDKLIGGFKTAVKDIPLTTTNFDENGVRQFVRKGNARIERLNARYKY
jgi:TP901 family phage tail tape measure protein